MNFACGFAPWEQPVAEQFIRCLEKTVDNRVSVRCKNPSNADNVHHRSVDKTPTRSPLSSAKRIVKHRRRLQEFAMSCQPKS